MGFLRSKNTQDDNNEKQILYKVLFDTYKGKIYRIAYYILRNEQDAKDVVQDTFISAFNKMNQLRDKDKFQSWICTIACNFAKTKYNRKKRELLIEDDQAVISISDEAAYLDIPEDVFLKKEFRSYLEEQVNGLSSRYREVVYLYYFAELSYEEICKTLDLSIGTVKSRLFRAKGILKENLEHYYASECSESSKEEEYDGREKSFRSAN